MIDLLVLLSTREHYVNYRQYVKENVLDEHSKLVLSGYAEYFEAFKDDDIDWRKYNTWFKLNKAAGLNKDKLTIFDNVLKSVEERADEGLDDDEVTQLVALFIERHHATRIFELAEGVAEGRKGYNLAQIRPEIEEWEKQTANAVHLEEVKLDWDIDSIVENTTGASGLDWRLDCLNNSLGPIRKGDFLILGKRPDTGGTTFAASQATFMAQQLKDDEQVLWFNNEEAGRKVQSRLMQAALNCSGADIEADTLKAINEYTALMNGKVDRILLIDKADLSVRDVDRILREHNVRLIVFDQLWKVHGFDTKEENSVRSMTQLFNLAREWAKKYAPALAIHQADTSAIGEPFPDMSCLYGSKTAIQGEADAIIMMGRTLEPGYEDTRFIWCPKNKMSGGPLTNPKNKHAKYELVIDTENAQFSEV